MVLESNRELVLRRLLECLARDRTKHQVAEVTSLGLVQMTRKRVGAGLLEAFSVPCECCNGRGVIVSFDPEADTQASHHVHQRGGGNGGNGSRGSGANPATVAARIRTDAPAADPADGQNADGQQADLQHADGQHADGQPAGASPVDAGTPDGPAEPARSGSSRRRRRRPANAANAASATAHAAPATASASATSEAPTEPTAPAAPPVALADPPQAQDGAA